MVVKAPEIFWQKGIVTVEDLSGKRPFLLRFHADADHIPGDVVASCVIAEYEDSIAEVKAWGGRKGPTTEDKNTIKEFCIYQGFPSALWQRRKNGREPKVSWIYN